MRAVNLLPEKHRPRRATGQQQGSAYAVLGVLGLVLVAVLCYVLTLNSINTKRDSTARAKAEAAKSEAQAKSLSAYGNFSQIKEERLQSVRQLAEGRFDWERLVREVAHVLPKDVWLLSSDASATPSTAGGTSTPTPGSTATGGPTVKLIGCARSQSEVATTLVRLRSMEGAVDVKLNQSQQPDEQTGGAAPAAAAGDGGATGDSCGQTGGNPNFKFEAEVSFEAAAPSTGGSPESVEVPARLGGGS